MIYPPRVLLSSSNEDDEEYLMSPVIPAHFTTSPESNYISIQDAYIFVLISLPFSSFLIPLFLLILFFSTSSSRRTWLFALNASILLLGISGGILNTIVQSSIIFHPRHPIPNDLFLTCVGITLYTPTIVDCILVLRLSAVYPPVITKRSVRVPILTIPILCIGARAILVTLLIHDWYQLGNQSNAMLASRIIWPRNPLIISDWSIQLFENSYCSMLFIYRLRGHKSFSSRMYREQSFASRLRAVFYISVSNFVFPTIFSIFQLVFIMRDSSVGRGAIVCMVNSHISIIGIVFCTIWCASDVWKRDKRNDEVYNPSPHFPELDLRQSVITLSGIAPNLDLVVAEPHHSFTFSNRLSLSSLRYHTSRQSLQTPTRKLVKSKSNKSKQDHRSLDSDRLNKYMQAFNSYPDIENSAESHIPIFLSSEGEIQMQTGSTSQVGLTSSGLGYYDQRDSCNVVNNIGSTSFDSVTDFDFVAPVPPPPSRQPVICLAHSQTDISNQATLDMRCTDSRYTGCFMLDRRQRSPHPSGDSMK